MALELIIKDNELFDPVKEIFIPIKGTKLTLEHSLISLSNWEKKWKIPYLETKHFTDEQTLDYIRCMTINKNIDPNIYLALTAEDTRKVAEYINDSMTATFFRKDERKGKKRIVTSELIYCWMCQLQIPFETEKWHLNRLLTLIRVCSEENKFPNDKKRNKMSKNQRNDEMARRRAKMGM